MLKNLTKRQKWQREYWQENKVELAAKRRAQRQGLIPPAGRRRTHGKTNTPEYKAWIHQCRVGCTSTFEEFYARYGPKPLPDYHFSQKYGGWHQPGQLHPLWKYLTFDNIQDLTKQVKRMCARGGYDPDDAMNEFWKFRLEKAKDPVKMASHRIKVYLPRIMSQKIKYVPTDAGWLEKLKEI